jgi:hypothetical protein
MARADLSIDTKVLLETVAVLRPGDTLVIAVSQATAEERDRWSELVADHLPGVEVVIVVGNALAVYRPGEGGD